MKCVVYENREEKIVEMTKELIQQYERTAESWSEQYCNYVVEIGWDTFHNLPFIQINGPWEC